MISRRRLLGSGAVVVAGGAGVAAGIIRPLGHRRSGPPPEWLVAAIDRERTLVAALDAVVDADSGLMSRLAPIRADHTAHAQALLAELGAYRSPSRSASSAQGSAESIATLRAAERAASAAAATTSAVLTGRPAVLLASIAACEASHAELLS